MVIRKACKPLHAPFKAPCIQPVTIAVFLATIFHACWDSTVPIAMCCSAVDLIKFQENIYFDIGAQGAIVYIE